MLPPAQDKIKEGPVGVNCYFLHINDQQVPLCSLYMFPIFYLAWAFRRPRPRPLTACTLAQTSKLCDMEKRLYSTESM